METQGLIKVRTFFPVILLRVLVLLQVLILFIGPHQNLECQELNIEEISRTIDSINQKLLDNYVFPDMAKEMAKKLRGEFTAGIYNDFISHSDLATQLTEDLQSISADKHLQVVYNPRVIAREMAMTDEERANEETEWIKELEGYLKRDNYGLRKVEILEGNIGYLDLREFVDPKYGGETLASVMNFLKNVDAVIIDLRKNDGGSPLMVQLLASYFFDSEPVHLTNFYNRPRDEHKQIWTLPYVSGTRMPDVDLYLLTSKETFSAAEGFSYHLKNLGRVTIVGENTAGGAHLTGSVIATEQFYVRIPQGRSINPTSGTDWEGRGVEPDIRVDASNALSKAIDLARKSKMDK